ncbi:MAG: hypothetical protein IT266_12155 [Saprospiraceae bacterium]|nr:hypothetical protein [Saprospiraceae bacterium]
MGAFKTYHFSSGKTYGERLVGGLMFLLLIALLFYLFYQLFILLWYAVPILLIVLLIMDARVLKAHVQTVGRQIAQQPISGLLGAAINLLGLPIVLIGLILKSWIFKRFGRVVREQAASVQDPQFTPYEEIESRTEESPARRRQAVAADHRYDDLFE